MGLTTIERLPMACPLCHVELTMAERHEVEIDYCPRCRGVWLDRGELDKILDRAGGPYRSDERREPPRYEEPRYGGRRYDDEEPRYGGRRYDDDDDESYPAMRHRRKRRGLLGELFDFD